MTLLPCLIKQNVLTCPLLAAKKLENVSLILQWFIQLKLGILPSKGKCTGEWWSDFCFFEDFFIVLQFGSYMSPKACVLKACSRQPWKVVKSLRGTGELGHLQITGNLLVKGRVGYWCLPLPLPVLSFLAMRWMVLLHHTLAPYCAASAEHYGAKCRLKLPELRV